MQCPECRELRYKRDWKPSQWIACQPVINDFTCCKICSPECYIVSGHLEAEALTLCKSLYNRYRTEITTELTINFRFRQFIDTWVTTLEYSTRKHWSHSGALRMPNFSREEEAGLPKPWSKDQRLQTDRYFDPGSWHYKVSMGVVLGEMPYNEETVGDIVESLLGLQYIIKFGEETTDDTASKTAPRQRTSRFFPHGFVNFLHDWCLALYLYFRASNWRITTIDGIRAALEA